MPENSIINIGDLSKPATVLIEKISGAIGTIFEPRQIVRIARAEAEANEIRATSQIQISEIQRRAANRFLEEEQKKQLNIENITQQAIPLLKESSDPQNIKDDWITNFFDKCRIVSDQEMQTLWASLLASEANTPGTYSRRTVNLLADFDKSDAQLFTNLCGFSWKIGNSAPLITSVQSEIYNRNGIDLNSLIQLESLGLIQLHIGPGKFTLMKLPKRITISYFERRVSLTLPGDSDNTIEVGEVLLTRAGQELTRICRSKPVDGFFEHVKQFWVSNSIIFDEEAV